MSLDAGTTPERPIRLFVPDSLDAVRQASARLGTSAGELDLPSFMAGTIAVHGSRCEVARTHQPSAIRYGLPSPVRCLGVVAGTYLGGPETCRRNGLGTGDTILLPHPSARALAGISGAPVAVSGTSAQASMDGACPSYPDASDTSVDPTSMIRTVMTILMVLATSPIRVTPSRSANPTLARERLGPLRK